MTRSLRMLGRVLEKDAVAFVAHFGVAAGLRACARIGLEAEGELPAGVTATSNGWGKFAREGGRIGRWYPFAFAEHFRGPLGLPLDREADLRGHHICPTELERVDHRHVFGVHTGAPAVAADLDFVLGKFDYPEQPRRLDPAVEVVDL